MAHCIINRNVSPKTASVECHYGRNPHGTSHITRHLLTAKELKKVEMSVKFSLERMSPKASLKRLQKERKPAHLSLSLKRVLLQGDMVQLQGAAAAGCC